MPAKVSPVVVFASAIVLASCQTMDFPPPSNETTSSIPAPRPAAGAPAPMPTSLAPRRLPGIRSFADLDADASEPDGALMRDLRANGLDVSRNGASIVLILGDDVLFGENSSEVSPRARDMLKVVAQVLKRYRSTHVGVDGFTDTAGTAAYNLKLSQDRASMVANLLQSEGIEAARITTRGFGERFLRVQTGDGVKEPRNRRVEITLTPSTG